MEAGKVRMVYYHFPFLGEESYRAALASECAGEQGAFWPYHETLYENQGGINKGIFTREALEGYARELGLDMPTFSQCLGTQKYDAEVRGDWALGRANQVNSTPTIFITRGEAGVRIEGAKPFSEVAPIIDGLLAGGGE